MRIGLDLRMLGGGSGISRYIQELSLNILKQDRRNEYVLFFNRLTREFSDLYGPFGQKMVETKISHYSFAEQFKLPVLLGDHHLDLIHFPHFNLPIFYDRKFVVTIHDLTHTKFPGRKKSHFLHRFAYNLVIKHAVKKAAKIITVSNGAKKEILEYFKVPEEKITVVYEGVDGKFKPLDRSLAFEKVSRKFNITKPYLLYVGVWRRYKNLPLLAGVFERLKGQGVDTQLVLAGEVDPFYPEIKQQVLSIRYADDVKILGRVDDQDLPDLFNAASLFVLPSFAEGFGLTALEAQACGVPVACSDLPSLREVAGQAAEYFDPHSLENMLDVIKNLLTNPTVLSELANLGLKRASLFSWQKAAEETIKLYESVV